MKTKAQEVKVGQTVRFSQYGLVREGIVQKIQTRPAWVNSPRDTTEVLLLTPDYCLVSFCLKPLLQVEVL